MTPSQVQRWLPPRRAGRLYVQKRARIVEVVDAGARVIHKQATRIHHDLSRGIELEQSAIHRARRWSLEVHTLAVVTATVTWALEFVFSRFPFGRTTQVRAAR